MLEQIRISGLVALEDSEIEFDPHLNVISGETGAGKTVLLTSLRLLTGERAEPGMIAKGRERAEVDAVAVVPKEIAEELREAGFLGDEDAAQFSRTVAREGRSKAAICGRPVPARALLESLGRVVTIHGQADQWRLKGSSAQRRVLDEFAGDSHANLLEEFSRQWRHVTELREQYRSLVENQDQNIVELRYLREVADAVHALELETDEEEQLAQAIDRLSNVQQLRDEVAAALRPFDSQINDSPVDVLGRTADLLRRASRQDPGLEMMTERAAALEAETVSLVSEMRDYSDQLTDDPDELARLHERRAHLTELMRGRATTVQELLEWTNQANKRIAELQTATDHPDQLHSQLQQAERALLSCSEQLTDSRKRAAKTLGSGVDKELATLGMANATLFVTVEPVELGPSGGDRVTMYLQAHPEAVPVPVGQGASGGELSRIMLALEVTLASDERQHTFVFDEIDAGIGGQAAGYVADRLKRLAGTQQVVVVTHQPQIAAIADRNLVVSKSGGKGSIRSVFGDERTDEIVRMLGSDESSDAARRHALDLERRAHVTIGE